MSIRNTPLKYQFELLTVMLIASLLAIWLRPTHKIADDVQRDKLEVMIPTQFAEWKEELSTNGQIVNPEVKRRLDILYSETLNRTYIDSNGQRIMLSIAYGADQSDSKQLHDPEVCYPSQGFQIESKHRGEIETNFGKIQVNHMYAVMGARTEPVTYWTTVGNKVVLGGKEMKYEQLKYGFKGQIPDGLLFRVSSISDDKDQAYKNQQVFINNLIDSLSANNRLRIAGI